MDQFFSKIFDKVKVTKPGVIGGIIFFVVGILLCIFGFWKTLFICLFTVAGFLFGTFFFGEHSRLKKILDRILPPGRFR